MTGMEVATLALEYLKAFLTPAPLAAGIVLFLLVKYREAIGSALRLLEARSDFQRKLNTAAQLNYLGNQFVRVGILYDKLLEDKLITPEQYRGWSTFAAYFKTKYPQIGELWKDAIEGNGRALGDQVRAESVSLTKAVVEFEGNAYRLLARVAWKKES